MARLLPTQTDAAVERSDTPAVLSLNDDATRDVIEALSSETAYEIFRLLNETPATPSRIADQLDQSVQNVHYHLENLEGTGLIEVTVYPDGFEAEFMDKPHPRRANPSG
jgi:DNA-binding transcriptional ArsR family regulator